MNVLTGPAPAFVWFCFFFSYILYIRQVYVYTFFLHTTLFLKNPRRDCARDPMPTVCTRYLYARRNPFGKIRRPLFLVAHKYYADRSSCPRQWPADFISRVSRSRPTLLSYITTGFCHRVRARRTARVCATSDATSTAPQPFATDFMFDSNICRYECPVRPSPSPSSLR